MNHINNQVISGDVHGKVVWECDCDCHRPGEESPIVDVSFRNIGPCCTCDRVPCGRNIFRPHVKEHITNCPFCQKFAKVPKC